MSNNHNKNKPARCHPDRLHWAKGLCSKCYEEQRRGTRGPDYHRKDLMKKYGITVEEYERLFELQQGLCAICKEPDKTGRRLAVDHDHKTGRIRGLLCSHCNTGIGQLKDSILILESAIRYLHE